LHCSNLLQWFKNILVIPYEQYAEQETSLYMGLTTHLPQNKVTHHLFASFFLLMGYATLLRQLAKQVALKVLNNIFILHVSAKHKFYSKYF